MIFLLLSVDFLQHQMLISDETWLLSISNGTHTICSFEYCFVSIKLWIGFKSSSNHVIKHQVLSHQIIKLLSHQVINHQVIKSSFATSLLYSTVISFGSKVCQLTFSHTYSPFLLHYYNLSINSIMNYYINILSHVFTKNTNTYFINDIIIS